MATVYFAKWILLPTFEILQNGAICVADGRILSVGTRSHVHRSAGDRIVNLGDMFLLPGLINIHTHLEENVLRDLPKTEHDTFAAWSAKRGSRLKQVPQTVLENSIRLGGRELLTHGITTVADFSRRGISKTVLSGEPLRSFVFQEIHPENPDEEDAAIDSVSMRAGPDDNPLQRNGTGPYSLYSISPKTHRALAAFAQRHGLLYAMHIAESSEELQAFSDQTGDLFFQITRRKGWPFGSVRRGSMDYALAEGLVPQKSICIHCNYVNGAELERLASLSASVALCFQYSEETGHKAFPLDVAMKRGVLLCAATESVSCERSMNLFDELYCARRQYPHIGASDMLRWITVNPAAALGAAGSLGSLDTGKYADIIGVRFHQDPGTALLDELIMGEPEVRLVIVNGEEVIEDY
jgi:cytosine/adenosine deaminase-related metal-dependent hydrolase